MKTELHVSMIGTDFLIRFRSRVFGFIPVTHTLRLTQAQQIQLTHRICLLNAEYLARHGKLPYTAKDQA
jgi:hypothetical protein